MVVIVVTFLNTPNQKAAIRLWAPDLTERRRQVQELFFRIWGDSQYAAEAWRLSGKGRGERILFPCNNPWPPSFLPGSPLTLQHRKNPNSSLAYFPLLYKIFAASRGTWKPIIQIFLHNSSLFLADHLSGYCPLMIFNKIKSGFEAQ